jgi:ribosomal protein S18 acetylase RimI-like enzyme
MIGVSLRPETAGDDPFIRRLILETVAGELGAGTWPEPMRGHLLGIQCSARRHLPVTGQVIQADGEDAGWVVVTIMPHEVRLVEIMVLPELRGRGIGTAAIRGIQAGAGKPVRLHVNLTNVAAIRLYERLDFRKIEQDDVQCLMESWANRIQR